jgi:hypothetical protein
MNILLDECLPRHLAQEIQGHHVQTVPQMGWAGIKNGDLLACMQKQFEVFITADSNLAFQQNLDTLSVAVVVLSAKKSRLQDLKALMPDLLGTLDTIKKGQIITLSDKKYLR